MLMLQISAAHGPAECQLAVKHALRVMGDEAELLGVVLTLLEEVPGPHGWLSVVLSLQGDRAASLARAWVGSVQWVCASPLRPGCLRKNWFIGVQALPVHLATIYLMRREWYKLKYLAERLEKVDRLPASKEEPSPPT